MDICIVAGARPNFIKVAPVVRALNEVRQQSKDVNYMLVYTGSVDDPAIEPTLFDDLQIPKPDMYLGVDCDNLNEQTGQVMSHFDKYLQRHHTDVVVVVDDLASTLAVAIVTKKHGVALAHIAAGTRSFDLAMPKEINRLVIDGLSDMLFTAGISNNSIANKEGAELSKVYMVGNVLIDNIRHDSGRWRCPGVLQEKAIGDGRYLLFTLNRKELLADGDKLRETLRVIATHAENLPVIAPLHGKVREVVERELSELPTDVKRTFLLVTPQGYLEFGYLTAHAAGIITDSGNVAEEATFYRTPCVTLNSYTEHIETVKVGSNELAGDDQEALARYVSQMVSGKWKACDVPDKWDGRTAKRIVQILMGA